VPIFACVVVRVRACVSLRVCDLCGLLGAFSNVSNSKPWNSALSRKARIKNPPDPFRDQYIPLKKKTALHEVEPLFFSPSPCAMSHG